MGLEPTASAVTVRRSNQAELQPPERVDDKLAQRNGKRATKLRDKESEPDCATRMRYETSFYHLQLAQSGKPGSNRRPSRWQRDALPTELFPRNTSKLRFVLGITHFTNPRSHRKVN
jgi:hypothetical protein